MITLGIETSCDETAVSILDGKKIKCEKIASQTSVHSEYGGVVPEIASREHLKKLNILLEKCLAESSVSFSDINIISVTSSPGLEGSLLVGLTAARALSSLLGIPLVEVDHVEAHLFAKEFCEPGPGRGVGLVVSGGHTRLFLIERWGNYEIIGDTRDDAAGEAFDKVASLLDLPYPGGPSIEKEAKYGDRNCYDFPVSNLGGSLDFSYSGLKTAVLYTVKYDLNGTVDENQKKNIAASFQEAALEPLVRNAASAAKKYSANWIFVSGGVAANSRLREKMSEKLADDNIRVVFPPKHLCTDNASMVAACGLFHYEHKLNL